MNSVSALLREAYECNVAAAMYLEVGKKLEAACMKARELNLRDAADEIQRKRNPAVIARQERIARLDRVHAYLAQRSKRKQTTDDKWGAVHRIREQRKAREKRNARTDLAL